MPQAPGPLRGHTLPELLAVLAIVAVLAAAGTPPLARLLQALDHDADVQALVLALALARRTAVLERSEVTVCPARPRGEAVGPGMHPCGRDWNDGVLVLGTDHAVRWHAPRPRGGASVRWRGFGSPTRLRWTPLGILRRQAGYFHLCGRAPGPEARIVLSAVGRVRVERRHPGGPPLQDGRGRALTCS